MENEEIDKDNKITNNIKVIKNENNQEIKNVFNKTNQINIMHKSVVANSKENKENGIIELLHEKNNYKTNGNEIGKNKQINTQSVRDRLLLDCSNNMRIELPSLTKNINKSPNINNLFGKNKLIFNNNGNESPSTSAFTNSTKKNNIDNNLTEHLSKYRMGLSSANSLTKTSNPIIPMLPINRPVSNFNFGGNQLWEIDNNKNTKKEFNILFDNSNLRLNKSPLPIKEICQKNEINNLIKNNNNKNRNLVKSVDLKGKRPMAPKYNTNVDIKNKVNNNIMPKMHKIKIEKGMIGSKLSNLFNMKLAENKNIFSQIKNNNNIFHMKTGNKSLSVKK